MGVLSAVAATSERIVEVGGIEWRLRRVTSADLMRVGYAAMVAAAPDLSRLQAAANDPAMLASTLAEMGPRGLERLETTRHATVCAAMVAQRAVGAEEWEEDRLVMSQGDEGEGRVWIRRIPAAWIERLATEANDLAGGGAEVAALLASFRGPTRAAGDARPPRKKVRTHAA